jgi:hypothetical protein
MHQTLEDMIFQSTSPISLLLMKQDDIIPPAVILTN